MSDATYVFTPIESATTPIQPENTATLPSAEVGGTNTSISSVAGFTPLAMPADSLQLQGGYPASQTYAFLSDRDAFTNRMTTAGITLTEAADASTVTEEVATENVMPVSTERHDATIDTGLPKMEYPLGVLSNEGDVTYGMEVNAVDVTHPAPAEDGILNSSTSTAVESLTQTETEAREHASVSDTKVVGVSSNNKPVTKTDLSPLLHFNEERSARMTKKPQKTKRPQTETPSALLGTTSSTRARTAQLIRNALPNKIVNNDEDGVTHINTSAYAKTELGRLLEMNARSPFNHPELGNFQCLGGLWHYLQGNQDDAFRTLSGRAIRAKAVNQKTRTIEGFKLIIAEAMWFKVQQNARLKELMLKNTLPYRLYYLQGEFEIRMTTSLSSWYPAAVEEIARVLIAIQQGQKDAVPDFEAITQSAKHQKRYYK